MAVIRDDDPAEAAELIVLKVYGDRGRVGIQPVPNEFGNSSDRLRPGLALQEIRLNFDGVFCHELESD